jgi:hypothetical protein
LGNSCALLARSKKREFEGSALAKAASAEHEAEISVEPPENVTRGWDLGPLRSKVRPVSALVLLAFVVCHLTAHSFLRTPTREKWCFFNGSFRLNHKAFQNIARNFER